MRTRAQGEATAVDVAYLATAYGVSEVDIQTLIDAPTTDLVNDFLQSVTAKTQEYDTLKAEKLKVDVELDNTVRTSETKVKAQKAAVTKAHKEVEELRTRLNESESAREALSTELDQLRSSFSGSTAETQALRQRIESLESSNREALALVESKSAEKDRIAQELSEQHSKLLTLRREISQLEEKHQSLENAATSQKFKEQSLQQEIELLKKNNEWHANELQTRSQENTKFRKERNARISTLERDLEDANANVEALKRTETTLRQRLDDVQAKADEAFARIASLQEEAARKEQSFKTELDGSKRLAELQAQNAATHKARLQEVQAQVDRVRDEAADEIGRLQAEIETERGDKETAERRVAELELNVERLEQQPRLSRPGTPLRNGEPQTPGRYGSRAGSPSAMPGSMRKVVNGLSFTQLYTKYTEAQEELEAERRRTDKLSTALDELVTELETRKPEIEDLKEEQERLENEVLDFSRLLDEANEARDTAVRESTRWQGEAEAALRESAIRQQQLRDMSAQIKILLVEAQSREQGLGEMSADERLELERAARGELDDDTLDAMTSTGRLISERLVIFRGVTDLAAQNEKLLRLTRELGEKMEGDEARDKARQSAADAEELESLRQQVERYKDELQVTATQIDSYMKERDMFRRMLQHRGQLHPDADLQSMFGQSIAPGTPMRNSVGPPATPRSKDVEDLNKLLKEQQTFFDQYRNESATDRRQLKEQVDSLAREKSTLQADLARAQSQLTLASERYDMLQSNFTALRNENNEFQKRSQQLAEQAAKQDLRTQQVAEELVEARSMAESLRNENANTKAEKELWKRIETRLNEENKTLLDDRSRLNKLVTDLQNLQNERELETSETRRRLQSRIDTLESELGETKKKVDSEVEDSRKAALRRQYEEGQSRTRIDDLVKSLGNVREELSAAKTARDQLQTRVDELKIELRSAEEKVQVLQPQPTPRTEPTTAGQQQANGSGEEVPAEQRLALELSDLRRDLELSKAELENAKQQAEQFRAIAQTTEEELANLSETADQYKEDTEQLIADKDNKVKELEQRIEDLNSELTTTNTELSELRSKADDNGRQLADQRATFEATIKRLEDDVAKYQAEVKMSQADVKTQAEIAIQAQENYEVEVQKHGEATKVLQEIRSEYNQVRTEVAGAKAEAEAAKVSLQQAEESWAEQRDQFERELEEVKRRRQDTDEQNKLLHQQMESFSNELAALRQGRAATLADGQTREGTPSTSGNDSNLQEVINYLRREKEIVDVQYELSTQEAKRLQQQLDYARNQLEEAQQKLADERRQSAEKASAENSTKKLMQTIEELNTYREATTTLRNDARQAREKLEEKTKQVDRLLEEIEPLKSRVGELEGELESKDGEMKLLQDDRDHWRERTQNIISKYDRVDPAELEEMKKRLEELKAENERLEGETSSVAELREQISGHEASVEALKAEWESRRLKLIEQSKQRNTQNKNEISELKQKLEVAENSLKEAQDALASARSELDQTKAQLEQANAALEEARTKSAKTADDDAEEGQVQEDGTAAGQSEEHAALHARIAEAEANASEHASRVDGLTTELQTAQSRVQELEGQVADLQQQLSTVKESSTTEQVAPTAQDSDTLDKLKQELSTAQQEVETLRASAASASTQPTVNAEPASGEKSVADQVAEEVAKLRAELEQQHELAKTQMEEEYKKKSETRDRGLRKQLNDGREKQRVEAQQELREQFDREMQQLKDEHNAALERLKTDHQAEIERLTKGEKVGASQMDASDANGQVKSEGGTSTSLDGLDLVNLQFTEPQVRFMLKENRPFKGIVGTILRQNLEKRSKELTDELAAKDEEIKKLTAELEAAKANSGADAATTTSQPIDAGSSEKIKDLEQKLAAAEQAKETAVKQAIDQVNMRNKLMINQKDLAQARWNAIAKAAKETPTMPVKEAFDVAAQAKPAAKPAAGAPSAANTPAKPAVAPSPFQAQAAPVKPAFGQPSAPTEPQAQSPKTTTAAPNPQASVFTPNASTNSNASAPVAANAPKPAVAAAPRAPGSGIPAPGGSKLPRAPPSRQPSTGDLSIQGAAGAARGNHTGIARGSMRGGRGGGIPRGGPSSNAGIKRSHDGAEPNASGETKKPRGGGAAGGGS
ncbi:Protein MLP1-like [Pseudocercospora fuligena]|uniref:Protein MLP1-like n=1 Tax=Pseudocercospora fuligena TaxID=685502 RepID=A0A8H6R923_9PEZI|nr:Protein MLP1-like [Pseudocercospora fuligena]